MGRSPAPHQVNDSQGDKVPAKHRVNCGGGEEGDRGRVVGEDRQDRAEAEASINATNCDSSSPDVITLSSLATQSAFLKMSFNKLPERNGHVNNCLEPSGVCGTLFAFRY